MHALRTTLTASDSWTFAIKATLVVPPEAVLSRFHSDVRGRSRPALLSFCRLPTVTQTIADDQPATGQWVNLFNILRTLHGRFVDVTGDNRPSLADKEWTKQARAVKKIIGVWAVFFHGCLLRNVRCAITQCDTHTQNQRWSTVQNGLCRPTSSHVTVMGNAIWCEASQHRITWRTRRKGRHTGPRPIVTMLDDWKLFTV